MCTWSDFNDGPYQRSLSLQVSTSVLGICDEFDGSCAETLLSYKVLSVTGWVINSKLVALLEKFWTSPFKMLLIEAMTNCALTLCSRMLVPCSFLACDPVYSGLHKCYDR
jgi:hypothetical protein